MMECTSAIRCRSVPLPAASAPDERQRLQDRLLKLETVEEVKIDGMQCRVRYRFPEMTFSVIQSVLLEEIRASSSFVSRLYCGFLAFMEENERDHLLEPCGWHYYLQHIHARRFDPHHAGIRENRRQEWQ